ncbi:putative WEB family protein [Helianthus debilis subsp. tardiflorus]
MTFISFLFSLSIPRLQHFETTLYMFSVNISDEAGMMFGFQVRNRQNAAASPRAIEPASPSVGEIDTKPPFESVKAAVNLFVEAPKADRPVLKKTRTLGESVLGKETQLHWTLKEIDKYKEHVKTAESTKGEALGELEKANKTLQELTHRLEAASESKQSSIAATEAARTKLKSSWQEAVENQSNQYKAAANQLISTKQQLNNLKRDFEIAVVAKQASFQRAAEAQHVAKVNRKKISQLSKDVEAMSQTLERIKLASAKAQEEHDKLMEEKQALLESKKKAKEDMELEKTECLSKKDPSAGNLEKRLEETSEAVNVLRDQLKEVRAADMEMLRNANAEVDEAKRRLVEMKEEESALRGVVESLKQELEDVRRDIRVAKEDDLKSEQLRGELEQIKLQVQEAITKETIAATHVNELESKIREMWSEAEKATRQEEEMKKQVETLWREAQRSELAIKDSEAKLEIAQRQVEEAKAAKELADDQIRKQSSKKKEDCNDVDSNTITLTTQDFEALSRKAEEATSSADTKVATIKAQLDAIKEKEKGILDKLEKGMQENKEIQEEISNAQQTADAARQTVEIELNKWRQETKQ